MHDQTEVAAFRSPSIRKVALASLIGTSVEWYDFFLYGTASALIFARLFFPTFDPLTGTLAAFGTFAVGFAARPIGGIVCGHFGDRIGRRSMLVVSLLIMGIATFLIGLLPTYHQVGIWAPILLVLLRIAQGFGLGGQWGGAVLMAVEHSPKGKRGFYGSWPQIGLPVGLLLSTLVFGLISRLPEAALLAWGWRVAFLVSIVLVGLGLYIRLSVAEPPVFAEVKQTHTTSRTADPGSVATAPQEYSVGHGSPDSRKRSVLSLQRICFDLRDTAFNRILQIHGSHGSFYCSAYSNIYYSRIRLVVGPAWEKAHLSVWSDLYGRLCLSFFLAD